VLHARRQWPPIADVVDQTEPEAMSGFTELPAGQKSMTLPTLPTESFDNIVREWRIQFRPASFR